MSNEFNGFNMDEDDNDKTELEWGDSFDDIDTEENSNDSEIADGSKNRTVVVIILAIVLIIVASIIYRVYKSSISNNESTNTDNVSNNYDSSTDDTSTHNITEYESDNTWSSVDSNQNITDNNSINTVFTVTSMQHQARVNSNEIEIRTIVTGSISGFTGTYEIIIPYNKGAKLEVADTFDICVYTGKYGEKTVVTGIEY